MDSTVNPVEVDGEVTAVGFRAPVDGKTPKVDFELLFLLGNISPPFLLPNPRPPCETGPGPVTV